MCLFDSKVGGEYVAGWNQALEIFIHACSCDPDVCVRLSFAAASQHVSTYLGFGGALEV